MIIKTNTQKASHHTQQVSNRGNLATISIPHIISGNSTAATRAQSSGTRLSGFLGRYQTVASSSANSITVLSNNIISSDREASQQFGN